MRKTVIGLAVAAAIITAGSTLGASAGGYGERGEYSRHGGEYGEREHRRHGGEYGEREHRRYRY